jgi:phosphodiesterase/alkaline phosphatase D-like protein
MSEINVVRNEMQAKFEQDLKDFKEKLIAKMEREIAETVKTSVKSALAGINAQINSSLQENNKIIYSNMQAERTTVTETMSNAVSSKVDLAVSTAVTRALEKFASTQRQTRSKSPFRKKRSSKENPETPENVDMTDGEKHR